MVSHITKEEYKEMRKRAKNIKENKKPKKKFNIWLFFMITMYIGQVLSMITDNKYTFIVSTILLGIDFYFYTTEQHQAIINKGEQIWNQQK
jgi:hypothetical protein